MSLSLSRSTTEKVRGSSVAFFSPVWEYLNSFKQTSETEKSDHLVELQHMQLENQLLHKELKNLRQLMRYQKKINGKLNDLAELAPDEQKQLKSTYQKALQRMIANLKWQVQALSARVIFRSFDQWNSSVWINVGEADNPPDSSPIIAKNSPVLIDQAVVGVVDYVGEHQSRVRLITDSRITPSVRAIRGGEQEELMRENIDNLLNALTPRLASALNKDEYLNLTDYLKKVKGGLQPFKKTWYLAKGELQGSLRPLGYGAPILKGTGFNYDFSDSEGESRDLRSGQTNSSQQGSAVAILKVNDILVTTGMDGIFPPDLKVAVVTKIDVLREGDYYYELEAKPLANQLEELSLVFVIPPMRPSETFDVN